MKGQLTFETGWEDPKGVVAPELRATWAHLTILVDGIPVTQVYDYDAKAVRDWIYLPLYPLAEWLAMNWWPLFYELEVSRRKSAAGYEWRHNLRGSREGFAFPNLVFKSITGCVAVEWSQLDLPACRVRFLQQGKAVIDAGGANKAAADLIRTVIRRLDNEGIVDTPLNQEWEALQNADPQERLFCQRVGALGLDPYSIDEDQREAVFKAADMLPQEMANDFFSIADPERLGEQATYLTDGLKRIASWQTDLAPLLDLHRQADKIDPLHAPWEQGYRLARWLRQHLALDGAVADSLAVLWRWLGLAPQSLDDAVVRLGTAHDRAAPIYYDALLAFNAVGSPGFMIEKRHETSQVFAFSRALFEYLTSEANRPVLISSAFSQRQKRNRAFAAEFLAPADLLRDCLPGPVLDASDVQELADQFKVSPFVITHQLENHGLARVMTF